MDLFQTQWYESGNWYQEKNWKIHKYMKVKHAPEQSMGQRYNRKNKNILKWEYSIDKLMENYTKVIKEK